MPRQEFNVIPVPDLKATNPFSRISNSGDLLRISSRLIQIWYDLEIAQHNSDLELIVRLILGTPREQCVQLMADQFRRGLPYRRALAVLFLAAIRYPYSPHNV